MGRYDTDGDARPTYGPNANPAERSAIVALIKRYYAIAAAGDGTKACAILDPLVVERLMEEHEGDKGAASLRGAGCPRLVSAVFDQHRRELSEDVATMQVVWVQLQAKQAVALVRFGPVRERVVRLRRRGGPWRMYALVDNGPL